MVDKTSSDPELFFDTFNWWLSQDFSDNLFLALGLNQTLYDTIYNQFDLLWSKDDRWKNVLDQSFYCIRIDLVDKNRSRLCSFLADMMAAYMQLLSHSSWEKVEWEWTLEEGISKDRMREALMRLAHCIGSSYEELLNDQTIDLFEDMYLLTKKETIVKYQNYFS